MAEQEPANSKRQRPKLTLRDGVDCWLADEQIKRIPHFQKLPKLKDRDRQSLILRRIRAGEEICRQSEYGHSAFYVLRTEDAAALKEEQLKAAEEGKDVGLAADVLRAELTELQQRAEQLKSDAAAAKTPRQVANVVISQPTVRPTTTGGGNWLQRFLSRPRPADSKRPAAPSGPQAVAKISEDQLIGEMCLLRPGPRLATVVAERDCYAVEFLRSIFESIEENDPQFKARRDEEYRDRVLENHIRQLPFFRRLTDQEFRQIKPLCQLVTFEPGAVIFREHDASDCMYVVRGGVVKVIKNAGWRLQAQDLSNRKEGLTDPELGKLAQELVVAGRGDPPLRPRIWRSFDGPLRVIMARSFVTSKLTADERLQLIEGVNRWVDSPQLARSLGETTAAVRAAIEGSDLPPGDLPALFDRLPPAVGEWSAADVREFNVALFKAACAFGKAKRVEVLKPIVKIKDIDALAKQTFPLTAKFDNETAFKLCRALTGTLLVQALAYPECAWEALGETDQATLRDVAARGTPTDEQRTAVVAAVNQLIGDWQLPLSLGVIRKEIRERLPAGDLRASARRFPQKLSEWRDGDLYDFNRDLLAAVCKGGLGAAFDRLPQRHVLAYLGPGEVFGEMGLYLEQARSASCVAFNHPDNQQAVVSGSSLLVPSRVELVRISREVFDGLLGSSPATREQIERIVEQRKESDSRLPTDSANGSHSNLDPQFEDLGLVQGQMLMLIDLDRCTRCGDCMRACVETHADGRNRLYLDGPRYQDRYLVPITCRKCVDPVCMIGCPTTAIIKGERGEMVIDEEKCIGCKQCFNQCPYGSIQMYPVLTDAEVSDQPNEASKGKKPERETAVVCDLCSQRPDMGPACVYHCPHDAAIRIRGVEELNEVIEARSGGR